MSLPKSWVLSVLVVALVAATLVLTGLVSHGAAPAAAGLGPEGVPIGTGTPLASPDTTAGGQPVDGISCLNGEQVAYHIHVHLAVFVDGHPRQLPAGIGIAPPRQLQATTAGAFVTSGACFYWLHTHAADGIVHVESPSVTTYTLGAFFDIWRQPLGNDQVGPARGAVTVFLNGHRDVADPRGLPLVAHEQITLDVGTPLVNPAPITFPTGL